MVSISFFNEVWEEREARLVLICWALSKEASGTIFITSLVWHGRVSNPRPHAHRANALTTEPLLRVWFEYCEIIFICWTFNFMYFVGGAIYEFKILLKYLFVLIILSMIWNSRIQVSTNMSIVFKPWNFVPMKLHYFTVSKFAVHLMQVMCISVIMAKVFWRGLPKNQDIIFIWTHIREQVFVNHLLTRFSTKTGLL